MKANEHQLKIHLNPAGAGLSIIHTCCPWFLVATILLSAVVNAEETPKEEEIKRVELEEVVVTGTKLSNKRIIEAKHFNTQISDSIASDDIASLPDFNIAEALARVPGISTDLDNGEDRFVIVRGLNSEYNFSTVDGLILPSTDEATRSVLFDIVPSSAVKRVDVLKSFTADLDGQAVGGRIDLITRSAFDSEGLQFRLNSALGYWEQNDLTPRENDPTYRINAAFSNTFGTDDQFGAVLSLSYDQRDNNTVGPTHSGARGFRFLDNPATPDVIEEFPVPEFFTSFLWTNKRERTGALAKLEYRSIDDNLYAYATGYLFNRDDNERRDQHRLRLRTTSAIAPSSVSTGTVTGGVEPAVEVFETTFKDTTTGVQTGFDWFFKDSHQLSAKLGFAQAELDRDDFRALFFGSRGSDLSFSYTQDGDDVFIATLDDPSAFTDASLVSQHFENLDQDTINEDDTFEVKVDYGFNVEDGAQGFGYKAGIKLRMAERDRDEDRQRFRLASRDRARVPLTTPGILLDSTGFNHSHTGLPQFFIDIDAARALSGASVPFNEATSRELSTQGDYTIEEDVRAVYLMGVYNGENYRITAGLRYEDTDVATSGFRRNNISGEDTFDAVNTDSGYTELLPRADLIYDFTDQFRLRAAYSKSLSRADYADLRPNVTVSDNGGNLTFSGGNPELDPRVSDNYDLSLEYYLDQVDGLVSFGIFYKEIENEIFVRSNTEVGVIDLGGGLTGDLTIRAPDNAEDASLTGFELGIIITSFDFFPEPFSNFGIAANAAYIDSEASFGFTDDNNTLDNTPEGASCVEVASNAGGTDLNCTRDLPGLFQQPDISANVALTYTKGAWDARLAWNYRGKRLRNIQDDDDARFDRFYLSQERLDAQLKYWVTDNLRIFAEAKNFTGTFAQEVVGDDTELHHVYRDVGPSYFLGISYKF